MANFRVMCCPRQLMGLMTFFFAAGASGKAFNAPHQHIACTAAHCFRHWLVLHCDIFWVGMARTDDVCVNVMHLQVACSVS